MLSIGILSHYAPKTLRNTLETYKKNGLFEVSDDIFAVLQMSNRQQQEIDVCNEFNIRYVALSNNGRMAWGFKEIYENAKYEYILFLENDFCIYCDNTEVKEYIENALYFLNNGIVDIIRGRSRKNPGEPNYGYQYLRHIEPSKFIDCMHLAECSWWLTEPEKIYPTKISKINPLYGNNDWYLTTAKSCNYSNNPYICSKSFFKHAILPYIEFGKNLEDELTPIWATKDYKCGFGYGIFTHNRSYDGHN